MGGARNRAATSVLAALLLRLCFCTAEDSCSTVYDHGKDVGCTEAFRYIRELEAPDLPEEIARHLYTKTSTHEQLFTWLVPTDSVVDAAQASQGTLASSELDDGSLFTRIVPIVGSVPVPEQGMEVEAQTVSGETLLLSADALGTIIVTSSESSSVAIIHSTLARRSEGAVQQRLPAANLQSCSGLVHVISAVHHVSELSLGGAEDVIVASKQAAGVLSAQDGGDQQGLHASVGRARRLLELFQRSKQVEMLAGGARSILQGGNDTPADPFLEKPDESELPVVSELPSQPLCQHGNPGCTKNCKMYEVPDLPVDTYCECAEGNTACIPFNTAVAQTEDAPASSATPSPADDAKDSAAGLKEIIDGGGATVPETPAEAPAAVADPDTDAGALEALDSHDPLEDSKDNFLRSGIFFTLLGIVGAVILGAVLVGAVCLRKGRRSGHAASKPISVGDNRALPHQHGHQYESNYGHSMQLRQAHTQPQMAVPPSPNMAKPEMEMQVAVGHEPDAHYGAPVHSSGYRGAPDAFGAVSGGYGASPTSQNNQFANGRAGETYFTPAMGAAAVGGVGTAAMNGPPKRMPPRNDHVAVPVSATAPIAGVHANKDIKEKRKRTPDSQKRALQMNKSSAKRGDGAVGMPTPLAQRSKPVLAALPLPIMSTTAVSPQTQAEISNLEKQIAGFGPHAVLGDHYKLINNVCLAKESSVVVNAQGVRDNLRYMITFFLNTDHYNVEKGLYSTAPLKGLVPRAHIYEDSNPLTGPDGSALPCAIVLERGETVSEWVLRRSPDASVKAEVLRNIGMRVRDLHDAGYVHCNLSPEAFKWYPRENRWMLSEFGHAARAGDARRGGAGGLSDTKITYAAPEGVAIDGRTSSLTLRSDVVAKVPLDVWSYAVVALEVMYGSPLLDASNEAEVRAQLGNVTPLPWEDEAMRSMIISSVGDSFASVLFKALQRTEAHRPSMGALHDSWRSAQRKMRNDQDQSASDLL